MKRGTRKRGFIQKLGVDLEGRKLRDSYTKLKKREKKKKTLTGNCNNQYLRNIRVCIIKRIITKTRSRQPKGH